MENAYWTFIRRQTLSGITGITSSITLTFGRVLRSTENAKCVRRKHVKGILNSECQSTRCRSRNLYGVDSWDELKVTTVLIALKINFVSLHVLSSWLIKKKVIKNNWKNSFSQ